MNGLNDGITEDLRRLALRGYSVAQLLRMLMILLPEEERHAITYIGYFRTAFCLALAEAKPVGGFSRPEYEMTDERLEELVRPEIEMHRGEWETLTATKPDHGGDELHKLPAVLRLTESIFSGPITIESDCDPENPDDDYAVLMVRAPGPLDLLLQQEMQWCAGIAALLSNANSRVRLVVVPE